MKNATPLFRRPVLARLMAGLAVALTLGAPLAAQAQKTIKVGLALSKGADPRRTIFMPL